MSLEISGRSKAPFEDFPAKFIHFTRSLNETVAQEVGMEKLCDLFVSDFHRLFGVEKILLIFIDDETKQFYLKRVFIDGQILKNNHRSIKWDESGLFDLLKESLKFKKPQWAKADLLQTLLPAEWFNQGESKDSEELIFVPLVAENRIKGALATPFSKKQESDPTFEYISAFCSWLTVAMDYAWHFEKLQNFNVELEKKVETRTAELKNSQMQLIQHEKMAGLGQLTAGIAHEINNPLAFVMNNVSLLKEDLLYSSVLMDIEVLKKYSSRVEFTENQDTQVQGIQDLEQNQLEQRILEKLALTGQFKADVDEVKSELINLTDLPARQLIQKFLQYAEGFLKQNLPSCESRLSKNLDFIEDSLEGLERTKKIVLDLRNFSRLDEAEFQFANIDEGITNTLNIIKHLAKERNILLLKDLAVPFLIPCYPSKLNQVIMNLVVNAIQASPNDGQILISSKELANEVQIMIQDFGVGIPEENITKIFDPYFSTKPIGEGTGLGLSLSYQIIEDHKGTIQVESARGSGTLFTIKLPFTERKIIS